MRLEITRRADLAVQAMTALATGGTRMKRRGFTWALHVAWGKAQDELVTALGETSPADLASWAQR